MEKTLKTFWDRLEWALARKLQRRPTQLEIAKRVHVGQSAVAYWKAGHVPAIEKGLILAQWCGASLDWLYLGRGEPFPVSVSDDRVINAVVHIMERYPAEERLRTLQYLLAKEEVLHEGKASADDLIERATEPTGSHKKLPN